MSASDRALRRRRRVWIGLAVSGGVLLALSSVGLVPMIREDLAVRDARSRYELTRLQPSSAAGEPERYRCGGRTVRPGDVAWSAAGRVVAFRWTDRRAGQEGCGVVGPLPPDTAAIRRAREAAPRTLPGYLLESVRGVRGAHLHGLRFRVVRWSDGDAAVGRRDFAYADWDGDPYGVLVANLLGTPVGVLNQSLSYWPSLLFPVLYPFGFALLGGVLLLAGFLVRRGMRAP